MQRRMESRECSTTQLSLPHSLVSVSLSSITIGSGVVVTGRIPVSYCWLSHQHLDTLSSPLSPMSSGGKKGGKKAKAGKGKGGKEQPTQSPSHDQQSQQEDAFDLPTTVSGYYSI